MSKPASKREQDLQRRHGAAPGRKRLYYGLGAAAVVLLFVGLVLQENAGASGLAAFEVDDDPYLGSPEASLALVGYESPHCSSCRAFHAQVLPQIQPFLDNGSLVYYFMQGTIMEGDRATSQAQECAYREGGNAAFWSLTDRLYARQGDAVYQTPDLRGWLSDLAMAEGLEEARLHDCLEGGVTAKQVNEDLRVGREHGARGTPRFWLVHDGEVLSVTDFTALPEEIAALLA